MSPSHTPSRAEAPLRLDLFVVTRILDSLEGSLKPICPTKLQRASGLNYTRLSRYLKLLARAGLVGLEVDEQAGGRVWMTERGKDALGILRSGVRILGEIQGGATLDETADRALADLAAGLEARVATSALSWPRA